MTNVSFAEFAGRKGYELAYALFQVSRDMGSRSFADRLEHHALVLLEESVAGHFKNAKRELETLEYFIRLGSDAGHIHTSHAERIFDEIVRFYRSLDEHEKRETGPRVSLDGVFSRWPGERKGEVSAKNGKGEAGHKNGASDSGNGAGGKRQSSESGNAAESIPAEPGKSSGLPDFRTHEIRQSKIIEIIRQSGNCRMKEIQESLPEVSERTLRYDLQSLVEKGVIERGGAGGPSTYYRMPGANILPAGTSL